MHVLPANYLPAFLPAHFSAHLTFSKHTYHPPTHPTTHTHTQTPQIGVDFALKVIQWSPDSVVRLQLWDIAGQERFGNMTRVYYKEAVGALVVFDVTRISTFDGVSKWKADIDEKVRLPDGSKIPVVLLANKVRVLDARRGVVSLFPFRWFTVIHLVFDCSTTLPLVNTTTR